MKKKEAIRDESKVVITFCVVVLVASLMFNVEMYRSRHALDESPDNVVNMTFMVEGSTKNYGKMYLKERKFKGDADGCIYQMLVLLYGGKK